MIKQLMLLIAIIPVWVQADPVYKWVDEKGVVHFSSKPHHEALDVETLEKPESLNVIDAPAGKNEKSIPAEENNKAEGVDNITEKSSPTPEQLENCKILKSNLNTLKNNPRVRKVKENGESEILGDETRQIEIGRIEKMLEESCR